jgi:hypothetical protein
MVENGLDEYVRFDEREDVLASMELIALLAGKVGNAPRHWKWLILAAHNALQGALVCALSGSDGTGALSNKSRREVLKAHNDWTDLPKRETLDDLRTLLKREREQSREPNRREYALCSTKQQHRDLIRLCNFRNDFAHFTPKGWSIQADGLSRIVLTGVDGASHVMLKNPLAARQLSDEQRCRIAECANQARSALGQISRDPLPLL